MAKKRIRKVKNRSKSTNRNSGFFAVSEVNVNPVNRTFLPDDTVARISTDDWWEDISIPGYTSKRNLLRKLQEDDIYDDTRIVTSPFMNWWSHVGSRNLPDHLPREHKISVSPTLPDVPATPEIQHVGRRIPQERFDNMWDEKTEDLSSNPRTIKNARGSVLQKPKPNLELCATENILEKEQHHSDSGNLSEHSLLYTSTDFTNRIRKQKGSKSIRGRKENYQKLALLNNIKKIELPDQNGSYESNKGHGSESESVKTRKIQLSKLMSCENNSISYPNVTDTYNNSLPERAQKTGRFYDAFKDDTVSITNKDLHLSQNSNKMLSDLSGVTDIKGRLSLSSSNTKDMKRARKQRKLLHVSWSGQIDPNNSNVQHRRNITSLLDMTNPSIKNEFESKKPPKNGLKYLQAFLDVSNEDKLSEVNYKQTGKEDESTFLSKLNLKPKSTQREQFLNIEDLNEIPSEKLLTQLSHSEHKVLTKMSSLSDGSDSELPLPRSTSFRFSSSPQSTRDTSVGNVPTVSKVKSKFLQNLQHDTSICDSLSAESTTGTGKKLILSRASRNAKRGLISDKLLAFSDVGENSKEKENETLLEEVETTLKNSRRDLSATGNVHADMKTKFTKSLAMTDLLTKQSAALHLQEENKSFLDTSQSYGSKNLNKLQHSKNYDTETELPNLQLGTSVLREVTENSKGSSILENRREAKHGVLESNNSRRDLSASEKERVQKTNGSRLHNITDSRSKLQQSLQDHSRHDISKEISSNLQHDPEITHEDVSKSEPKVNNRSRVFSETDKEKQVHFESNEHSDQEASKSLMGDKQVPKRRSQRLSSQHSKNDNDASKLFTDQLSHQSDEENANDSGVSATRKKVEHGVQVPKNSRRDLSASEKESAQERSKDLRLHIVTDSPSKQSTKQQLHHRDLSKHSMAKEVSSKVQHEREITLEDVSRSESEVNNQSRVFSDTDKEKQVHFESNVHSDQEASKSLMGDKQVPKRRNQRLSSQHSKNDNDASKLFTDQLSHQSDEENANDSGVSAVRKQAEHGVQVPKNSRRDLSASEIVSAQEKSKDLRLHFVTDSPSKQSTKQQPSHQGLSQDSTSKEISSNMQHEREITHEDVSKSESEVNNQCSEFLEKNEQKHVHFEVNTLSRQEESMSFLEADQASKCRSLRISSQQSKNVDNDVSNLVSDISLLQGVGENSNESRINVSEKRGGQRVMIQKNSGKGLSASENMNVEEARKHSVSNVISSTDRSTLQRTLQDLMKSFTTERVSANANNEREITHEGSVSKLTNRRRVCLESCEKEQSSVRSNIYSGNKDESTSLVKIAQTSKDEVRLKSLDSMNVFISPVIAQGVKRRIMKQGIADHSKSVPASSITQPGMKLVPSEKHDSRGKMNSHLTINTSQSSRDVVKSPENISNNKSQPQRLRSNMESVFRTHTSTSNKDKYQKETNNESVKDTKSPSARIRTKSSTSQSSFPQSKVIALDSKSESMKNNSKAIDTVISKSKFMGNKFNTLFLEVSRPKKDERDILSTTIVENNLGIMSQKLSAVRSHLKRQHEKLTLLQYRKACKQIQTHPANYAKFKKLLAHREKMEDIFNVNDRHSSKNNHVLNIRSQKKDIAEKKSNRETERVASILQYVKSTKSPLRISWGNAVGHPKLTAAVSKTKTSVNRKLKTSDRDVIIIRDVNKAPRIKRPTWLHARLYKSLSKTIVMKIKDKNVINPQKESQEIISKLGSLIDKALRYRRKGCNPFVDEVIKHLYHSAIIKTPMNFICFCMRYLPETFVDIALRVKENDSGILGNVIDRDLNL